MLLILIPAVWITVAAFFVIVCRSAALGDAGLVRSTEAFRPRAGVGALILYEDQPARVRRELQLLGGGGAS